MVELELAIAWKVSIFGVILVRISLYSVRIPENADQNNSEYGHFLRSEQHNSNVTPKNLIKTILLKT